MSSSTSLHSIICISKDPKIKGKLLKWYQFRNKLQKCYQSYAFLYVCVVLVLFLYLFGSVISPKIYSPDGYFNLNLSYQLIKPHIKELSAI
jgi:hypothetical protein